MNLFGTRHKQPRELKNLMAEGFWPKSHEEAIQQNLSRRIPSDRVHRLIETEDEIFLYPDPCMTLASEHEASRKRIGESEFYAAYDQTLGQIDPTKTLFIADFGPGSDAPIALDFRDGVVDPPVIGLKWDDSGLLSGQHRWVKLADTFSDFVQILGIRSLQKFKG
jgi:hypothetical protein